MFLILSKNSEDVFVTWNVHPNVYTIQVKGWFSAASFALRLFVVRRFPRGMCEEEMGGQRKEGKSRIWKAASNNYK